MGDIISGFWRIGFCQIKIAFVATVTAVDGLALIVITEVRETYQAIISEQNASL